MPISTPSQSLQAKMTPVGRMSPAESHCLVLSFVFWLHPAACGILVPQWGVKPVPPIVKASSLNMDCQGSPKNHCPNVIFKIRERKRLHVLTSLSFLTHSILLCRARLSSGRAIFFCSAYFLFLGVPSFCVCIWKCLFCTFTFGSCSHCLESKGDGLSVSPWRRCCLSSASRAVSDEIFAISAVPRGVCCPSAPTPTFIPAFQQFDVPQLNFFYLLSLAVCWASCHFHQIWIFLSILQNVLPPVSLLFWRLQCVRKPSPCLLMPWLFVSPWRCPFWSVCGTRSPTDAA